MSYGGIYTAKLTGEERLKNIQRDGCDKTYFVVLPIFGKIKERADVVKIKILF